MALSAPVFMTAPPGDPTRLFIVEQGGTPAEMIEHDEAGRAVEPDLGPVARWWGRSHQTVGQVSARYVPWIWWGLLVIILSGLLMLTAEPIRNMVNAVFWIKMVVLVVTVLITLSFQKKVQALALAGGAGWQASSGTRTTAILIILLWWFVMLCGRWIAYVPV